MSLIDRLGTVCANTDLIYANIGVESRRDVDVFEQGAAKMKSERACAKVATSSRHGGIVHQVIMLTGQHAAFQGIHADDR